MPGLGTINDRCSCTTAGVPHGVPDCCDVCGVLFLCCWCGVSLSAGTGVGTEKDSFKISFHDHTVPLSEQQSATRRCARRIPQEFSQSQMTIYIYYY